MCFKLLSFIFIVLSTVESANILGIYPIPSISHQVVFRRVTLELVKQGHDVTVITADPAYPKKDGPKNLKEIDVHDISYGAVRGPLHDLSPTEAKAKLSGMSFFSRLVYELCEVQFEVPEVQEILNGTKKEYDLILVEEFARSYLAVTHIYKAPVILFSSFGGMPTTYEVFGLQTHPILYPSPFDTRLYGLTTWEKINKFYKYFSTLYEYRLVEEEEHRMLQKYFGPDIPKISDFFKNVDMLFLNIHSIWVDNGPVPPSVVFLGGLHQLDTKELPTDLKNYLDSSKNGVIYVSFGTNALSTMLERNKIQIIAKILGQMPYDVLWKWDKDTLPGQTKNIKLSKWLPQADLLKHPKIKLFITQAGLQSTDEAITAGVPLVAFPVLGDQWFNAEKYVRHGIGKKILFEEATEEVVKNSIETVLNDQSYRKNIINLRNLMYDQPMQPLERAMFWINHVIRNKGGKHLLPAGANLTWTQYYELELLFILLATILTLIGLSSFVVYYMYKHVKITTSYKIKDS